jgi:hypothetical protein
VPFLASAGGEERIKTEKNEAVNRYLWFTAPHFADFRADFSARPMSGG